MKESIFNAIKFQGMQVIAVAADPCWVYTVGLSPEFGFELLVVGLPPVSAHAIFTAVRVMMLEEGKDSLKLGVNDDRWANLPSRFYLTDPGKVRQYVIHADSYFAPARVEVVQLVMPDDQGVFFDGGPSYNEALMDFQPLLFPRKETLQ